MRPFLTAPVAGVVMLAACSQSPRPEIAVQEAAPSPVTRMGAATLDADVDADRALAAFRRACPRLTKRTDMSGLTTAADWEAVCADAGGDAHAFFARNFSKVRIADGRGLVTGYFEPEIAAFRHSAAGAAPIYARPADLIDIDLGAFNPDLKGKTIRGRFDGKAFVPYPDRGAIDDGALSGRGLELAWAADPVELFFLQIQGSGRLRFPDGAGMRIGYAGQNGRPYVAIGRLLRERGLLEKPDMPGIIGWLRANPAQGEALMRENPSYVFFRRLPDSIDGPLGSLGVPLLAEGNVAIDPAHMPYGAPVLIDGMIEGVRCTIFGIAADTGGAIRGVNRIDIFWGHGAYARRIAGSLSDNAGVTLLLPNSAAARLPSSRR